jgi:hypothetical protein
LEISFPEPHNPIQVPKPYFGMYPPEQVPERLAGPEALKAKGFWWQWMHGLEEGIRLSNAPCSFFAFSVALKQ